MYSHSCVTCCKQQHGKNVCQYLVIYNNDSCSKFLGHRNVGNFVFCCAITVATADSSCWLWTSATPCWPLLAPSTNYVQEADVQRTHTHTFKYKVEGGN